MDGAPPQEAFQLAASDFHKGRVEAPDRLLFWKRRDNRPRSFDLESIVQPQKVAVPAQDGRKDLVHVAVGRPDIDAVRGVFVDSLGVLNWIRDLKNTQYMRVEWFFVTKACREKLVVRNKFRLVPLSKRPLERHSVAPIQDSKINHTKVCLKSFSN